MDDILQISAHLEKKARAVIEGGVRDLESFLKWRDLNPDHGIVAWMP